MYKNKIKKYIYYTMLEPRRRRCNVQLCLTVLFKLCIARVFILKK